MLKRVVLAALILATPLPALASGGNRAFPVAFNDCTEYVGFGPVSFAEAQALVPQGFVVAAGGGVVVRAANCMSVSVDGEPGVPALVSHVGVNIESPDGTGDINNYTFWYYTDHKKLAKRLQDAGVAAKYVPDLEYDYDPGCHGHPAELKVKVPAGFGAPRLKIKGTVVESQTPAGSFDANWWRESQVAGVKMATSVPIIDIGTADLQLSNANGALAQLIGGDTLGFPILQQFNTFDDAHMSVTTP